MTMEMMPYCLRALLPGACSLMLLAACEPHAGMTQSDAATPASYADRVLAEREARHFDMYKRYRAEHDRPRHLLTGALQDDADAPMLHNAVMTLRGASAACSRLGETQE